MCSRETVTRMFTVRGGACGDMWGWGGVGRGACWEGASPDPSSNLHYMFKLIKCTIYLEKICHLHILAMSETFILQFLTLGACTRDTVVVLCVYVCVSITMPAAIYLDI